jgi:hypothetical protein
MGILNKNLPPPPAPIEMSPAEIENKLRQEAEETEKQAVARRLDEARKRLGKLSPQLIEDIRLICNAAIDEVAMLDFCDPVTGKHFGVPFEVVRRDMIGRAGGCACAGFMMIKDRVK